MSRDLRLFVLQKHSLQPHVLVGNLSSTVPVSPTETVESLTEIVRGLLKSHSEFGSWGEDVEDIEFVVHRSPLKRLGKVRLVEMANDGQLGDNTILESSKKLATLEEPSTLIFVFQCLSLRFTLFERIGSSFEFLTEKKTAVLPSQTVDVIKRVAQHHVKLRLGSKLEPDMRVFELVDHPTPQDADGLCVLFRQEFNRFRELDSDSPLGRITNREHIVISFTFRFNLFLFERGASSHCFAGSTEVIGWSRDSVKIIQKTAEAHVENLISFERSSKTGITVDSVKVFEPAEEAHNNLTRDEIKKLAIDDKRLARSSGLFVLLANGTLRQASSRNLIIEYSVKRDHLLEFRYALFEQIGTSLEFLAVERKNAFSSQKVDFIKGVAQHHVKLRLGSKLEPDMRVFELVDHPTPQDADGLCVLFRQEFNRFRELDSDSPLGRITNREHIVISFTFRFNLFLFEREASSHYFAGSNEVMGWSRDSVEIIQKTAEAHVEKLISIERSSKTEITVDSVKVFEPAPTYEEAHNNLTRDEIEKFVIDDKKLARSSGLFILLANGTLRQASSRNLVIEYSVKRDILLEFSYALFERNSKSFQWVGYNCVEGLSTTTAQGICNIALGSIKLLPNRNTETGHSFKVYQPMEAFTETRGKTARDLERLQLEERHLQPPMCCILDPHTRLSQVNGQTLIIVFSTPYHSDSTLSTMLSNLAIVKESPSQISKHEEYQKLQNDSTQRNFDNRPFPDRLLPPISLLYDGFGVFADVRRGFPVPGEDDILENTLRVNVNKFVWEMGRFFGTEAMRRDTVISHLNVIFGTRKNPGIVRDVIAGKFCPRDISSDGHMNGQHKTIMFCFECKNEQSGVSCNPSAQLVSYIASSFHELSKGEHRALLDTWRLPALGMTLVGPFVQFFGIVMLSPHMRVDHLTPVLPLAISLEDEDSKLNVFLAFKAASIVVAKLQDDAQRLIQQNDRPKIPLESRCLPNVSEINAYPLSSPPSRIGFTLLGRYDTVVDYRNLYHARLDSVKQDDQYGQDTGRDIYVKFTQKYSAELHAHCAAQGLAPKLIGFERLVGGWIAVAMEKVDTVKLGKTESSEVDEWKGSIQKLVEDFHRRNLVHGDLRLANFIFTKPTEAMPRRRMMLVDFDWGGGVGEAFFPPVDLTEELGVDEECYYRKITIEHDREVLEKTFARLDALATGVTGAERNEMDVDAQ